MFPRQSIYRPKKKLFLSPFSAELSSSQDQTLALQRLIELLPTVNRDTLFVLLHFLGLVAENAEDRKLPDGE